MKWNGLEFGRDSEFGVGGDLWLEKGGWGWYCNSKDYDGIWFER
jgi:hypothetical protein